MSAVTTDGRLTSWYSRCAAIQARIISFSARKEDFLQMGKDEFSWGLLFVVLVGMGRVWDKADANIIFRLGLPSVACVFGVSLLFWFLIAMLKPVNWVFGRTFILISMTALPGLVYALPLESMMTPDDASVGNTVLLIIVATWRVLMLGNYIWRVSGLSLSYVVLAILLPILVVINTLILFEQFEKTFTGMGGIRYMVPINEKEALEEHSLNPNRDPSQVSRTDIVASSTKPDLIVGRTGRSHLVYRYYDDVSYNSPAPTGYREVAWDDPEYVPPEPLMAILLPLKNVSMTAFPILSALYLVACLYRSFIYSKKAI